ncbi:MAG: holo-ACP synthase [Planctomycetia bacterium]|nr:holo-ACP synthase [Planctomycetia bacterium]
MDIFGIGTDITSCERIGRMIERHGDYFLTRVYTDWELEYCRGRKQFRESFTGRWCAKEAILKALGTGWIRGIAWRDMEIRALPTGAPYVLLGGGVLEAALLHGVSEIQVSISHCDTHATAMALALRNGLEFPMEKRFERLDKS